MFKEARQRLIHLNPFWGSLLMRLELEETDKLPTAGTDGVKLLYNPAFVKPLILEDKTFLLLHEVAHVALSHMSRRGERDPKLWNVACDLAIHSLFKQSGEKIHADALYDSKFNSMSVEQIYEEIKDDSRVSEQASQQIIVGDVLDNNDPVVEQEWKEAIQVAMKVGDISEGLKRTLTEMTEEKVDWRAQLRNYLFSKDKSDYNWSRPNRRYVHMGIYLPALHNECLGKVSIIVDTSGSIDEEALGEVESELKNLFMTMSPSEIQIIYCDCSVVGVEEIQQGEDWNFNPVGGGGTDMNPALEVADGDVVLCFTDGYMPKPRFREDVIWLLTSDVEMKFGVNIRVGSGSGE